LITVENNGELDLVSETFFSFNAMKRMWGALERKNSFNVGTTANKAAPERT
jgi:hypothetical protein